MRRAGKRKRILQVHAEFEPNRLAGEHLQESVVREIRMLRLKRRGLETEPRSTLHGHEGGNPGNGQEPTYWATAPVLDPTGSRSWFVVCCANATTVRRVCR